MRFAFYLSALTTVSGCTLLESTECTEIGCVDGVTVSITTLGGFPDGQYMIDAKMDGQLVHADCTIARASSSCTQGIMMVRNAMTGGLKATLPGAPAAVEVTLFFEGRGIGSDSFAPTYNTFQPNGGTCGPTCRQATHPMTIASFNVPDAGADG